MKTNQLWTARPKNQTVGGIEYDIVRKGFYAMRAALPLQFVQSGAKRIPQGMILALAILFLTSGAGAETNAVNLASSSGFAVLAGAGITVAGPVNSTVITGDIGAYPTPAITGLENAILNGTNHAGDGVTQGAQDDLTLAYNDAVGRTATTYYGAIDLNGYTLTSGIYNGSSAIAINGLLTLDAVGDPNAVWIFQIGSTLDTGGGSQISLINGAQAANVFWQVGSSATLGASSAFSGTILALTSITLNAGATVDGRVLARNGAVSLNQNTINAVPEPATFLLFGIGGTGAWMIRRNKIKSREQAEGYAL